MNTFWITQSIKPVIDAIRKLNKRNKAVSIATFDFSTLYTKIPHQKLISVLHSIIDFCFKGGTCEFIAITRFGARWVKDKSKYNIWFDKQKLKDAVTYLMENCYFTVGKDLFRQIIGIPMGSDPAPFFANLFLYFYERNWILDLKKKDQFTARKFSNTFRFIDDLNAINDGGEFEKHHLDIYPTELQLSRENDENNAATFLDLDIKIIGQRFSLSLYDKRDAFPFNIVRMPFKSSNMPTSIFYDSVAAKILRIGRATTNSVNFTKTTAQLIARMQNQGAAIYKLKSTVSNVLNVT